MKPHSIRDYLTFLNKEKNGVILFCVLVLLIKLVPYFIEKYVYDPRIAEYERLLEEIEKKGIAETLAIEEQSIEPIELYSFDPNLISKEELLAFGLSPKSANSWVKARENGYKFYSKESVKALSSLESDAYHRIENFITIPSANKKSVSSSKDSYKPKGNTKEEKPKFRSEAKNKGKAKPLFFFDPNTVSREELLDLGLKDFVADNLIKWREKGKVFYAAEDVKDVHALLDNDFQRIKPFIQISSDYRKPEKEYAKNKWDESIEKQSSKTSSEAKQSIESPSAEATTITMKRFNPNEVTEADLISFGVDKRVARIWQNLLKAGGRFYKPEDISKVIDLSEEDYSRLLPYADVPSAKEYSKVTEPVNEDEISKVKSSSQTIDINYAKEEEWGNLEIFNKMECIQIIKLKEALGGFHRKDQLLELPFIDKEKMEKIVDRLTLHKYTLRKVKINEFDQNRLQLHPYIKYNIAKDLVKKRKKKGPFTSDEDIIALGLFDESTFRKLAPYLEY